MIEVIDDEIDYYETLYKKYYTNILEQMEKQGFSKVHIFAQKVLFENDEDIYDEFCDKYELEFEEDENTDIK